MKACLEAKKDIRSMAIHMKHVMEKRFVFFSRIDGQMQSIDDKTYIKYFSVRRKNSKWSDKNKTLVEGLEKQGLMTDYGRRK